MLQKLKIDRRLLKQLDYSIILIVMAISLFGCINIFSATQGNQLNGYNFYYFKLQLIWVVLGLIIIYFMLIFDYLIIANYAGIIYWISIGLLVFNNLTSSAVRGSSNWIQIGSRAIQPSEFVKIAMVIMIGKKLYDMEGNINNIKNFSILAMYALIPMFLIVIAPDMGMTMVCFFIVLGIFFVFGLDMKVIGIGIATIVMFIIIFLSIDLSPKYEYMKRRLTSFVTPESDVSSSSYQLVQSVIGIGSGGILGKGFLQGTQVRGGYVPEPSTDFIFAVIGEEWGFVGSLFLVILYSLLIYKLINIAKESKDIFGSVLCIGFISGLMFSILQNVGMTIGIMPISGITLPFVSYGGSSMISNFIWLGLALNVGMRRKKINF